MAGPSLHTGLAGLADRYDAFLLDSWGVLQNGIAPLEGVNDCLRELKTRDKALIILSNSARRAEVVTGELSGIGLDMSRIARVITGGEAAWQALHARADDAHKALGESCYYLGSQRSRSLLQGLNLAPAPTLEEAGFVLCTSPPDSGITPAFHQELVQAQELGLTMVCANPDLVAYHGDDIRACAGKVAQSYETLGGRVIYHGKPHKPFYDMAFSCLDGLPLTRILAVGDGFATDMAGAARAGVDALFVTGGIHRERLSDPQTREAELAALCREKELWPMAAVTRFSW